MVLPVLLMLLLVACPSRREVPSNDKLPRIPDLAGEVTEISVRELEINEGKKYPISSQVQSFSTYNQTVISLLSWKGKYVHVGLEDGNVIWIAGIGIPDKTADPPVLFYTNGLLRKVDSERRLIFVDGTVLKLDPSVGTPPIGSRLTAKIDAKRNVVVQITLLETPLAVLPTIRGVRVIGDAGS